MSEVFIPKGTEWYVGQIVEEFKVHGETKNLVHINTVLIRANSPERAYEKALELGRSVDRVFTNTDGAEVCVHFRGISGLFPVYDKLEDGAELLYEEHEGLSETAIQKLVQPKGNLAVFAPSWGTPVTTA